MGLLNLVLMCKNSGPTITKTLKSYLGFVDFFIIYDTGSTDDTIKFIRKFMFDYKQKYVLVEEPFIDFSTSRNRSLDLADKHGKGRFHLIIDDTFELKEGRQLKWNLLTMIKLNLKRANILIQSPSGDSSFASCRIIKKYSKLRYEGLVHETIKGETKFTVRGPYLVNHTSESNKIRTEERLFKDLITLEKDPHISETRKTYYLACTYFSLADSEDRIFRETCIKKSIDYFCKRLLNFNDTHYEERLMALLFLSSLYLMENRKEMAIYWYKCAIDQYPPRNGEVYFNLYLLTGDIDYLIKAKENPLGNYSMSCNTLIYTKLIDLEYLELRKELISKMDRVNEDRVNEDQEMNQVNC